MTTQNKEAVNEKIIKATKMEASSDMMKDRVYIESSTASELKKNSMAIAQKDDKMQLFCLSKDKETIVVYTQSQLSDSGWEKGEFKPGLGLGNNMEIIGLKAIFSGPDTFVIVSFIQSEIKPTESIVLINLRGGRADSMIPTTTIEYVQSFSCFYLNSEPMLVVAHNTNNLTMYSLNNISAGSVLSLLDTKIPAGPNRIEAIPAPNSNDQIDLITYLEVAPPAQKIYHNQIQRKGGKWELVTDWTEDKSLDGTAESYLFVHSPIAPDILSITESFSRDGTVLKYSKRNVGDTDTKLVQIGSGLHSLKKQYDTTSLDISKIMSIGMDQQGIFIFGIDQNDSLCFTEQNGKDELTGSPKFKNWKLLGDRVGGVFSPHKVNNGPEAFFIDNNNRVVHKHRNNETGLWTNQYIDHAASPEQKSVEKAIYVLRVALFAENNILPSDRPLQINVNKPATLIINNHAHRLWPGTTKTINSNKMGVVRIKIIADGISSPVIGIRCEDFMAVGQFKMFSLDNSVHKRLSGEVNGFEVSAKALKENGILPPHMPDATADHLSNMFKASGSALVNYGDKRDGKKVRKFMPEDLGWSITFGQKMPNIGQKMPNISTIDASIIQNRKRDWLFQEISELGNLLSQLWHEGIEVLREFKIVVIDGIFHFVVKIYGEVKAFVLDSIEHIGAVIKYIVGKLEQLFGKILGPVLEKFLNWLSRFIDWEPIIRVTEVSDHMIKLVTNKAQSDIHKYEHEVGNVFNKLKDNVEGFFKQKPEIGDTQVGTLHQKHKAVGDSYHQAQKDNGFMMHFVVDHVNTPHPRDTLTTSKKSYSNSQKGLSDTTWDEFTALSENISSNLFINEFLTNAIDTLKNIPPDKLSKISMNDLIEKIFKDEIKDFIDQTERFILGLMKEVGSAVAALEGIFEEPLNIPVLGDIYERESKGKKFTEGSLATFALATPAHLLHEIIHDGKPLFSKEAANSLLQLKTLGWPVDDSSTVGKKNTGSTPSISAEIQENLDTMSAILSFIRVFMAAGKAKADLWEDQGKIGGVAPSIISIIDILASVLSKATGRKLFITEDNPNMFSIWAWWLSFAAPLSDLIFLVFKRIPKPVKVSPYVKYGLKFSLGVLYIGLGAGKAFSRQTAPSIVESMAIYRGILVPIRYLFKALLVQEKDTEGYFAAIIINVVVTDILFSLDGALKAAEIAEKKKLTN